MQWHHRLRCSPYIQLFVAGAFAAVTGMANAQPAYPVKPLRLVVPFAPGGSTDTIARLIGQKLDEALGQQVIIDNRPGAGGNLGVDYVAKSVPDGYTLIFGHVGTFGFGPSLYAKLPYDLIRDFAPVALFAMVPNMLVVHPSLPVHSVRDLISYARANPRKLNFGSSGAGRADHLAGQLFNTLAGVNMQHVPYKGGAPAMIDLLAGNIQLIFATVSTSITSVRAGKVRAIAVTSAQRVEMFPDIPTVAEAGG